MRQDEVRRALDRVGLSSDVLRPIGEGWANWTYLIDGQMIVRFPRNDEVAQATRRELCLLPALQDHVSFEVPVPTVVGSWAGRPFFGYTLIEGRPLCGADQALAPALGEMLAELHDFPVEQAAELLGSPRAVTAWQERYQGLWQTIAEVALPELDRALADAVKRGFSEMVERPPVFPTCLIHNDLGPVHVLVGKGRPVGIIDFEDACLGDPATDLTPLVACLGTDALPDLVGRRDLGERLDDRLRFYRWMGSIHAIIYGVREGVTEERVGGVQELRRRLPLS